MFWGIQVSFEHKSHNLGDNIEKSIYKIKLFYYTCNIMAFKNKD